MIGMIIKIVKKYDIEVVFDCGGRLKQMFLKTI